MSGNGAAILDGRAGAVLQQKMPRLEWGEGGPRIGCHARDPRQHRGPRRREPRRGGDEATHRRCLISTEEALHQHGPGCHRLRNSIDSFQWSGEDVA